MPIVKFGDVVKEVKNKVDRTNNPYEYYIAGDHMDSEDLHLHRKGSFATDDVGPAFIREFKPGQILYGSRRTYLKKVAVADFSGVTANTTFVLETVDENILRQRLIPFIMLSNGFTKWSIGKSKGSTNPYVLFSDLADYEFNLPDIELQDKLVKLLWAMDESVVVYKEAIEKTDELVKSQFIEMFGDPVDNPKMWPTKGLMELGTCKNGMNFGANESGIDIRCVGVGDVKDLSVIDDLSTLTVLSLNAMPQDEYLLKDEDIIFVRSNGNKELVGRCVAVYPGDEPLTFSGFCIRFRKTSEEVCTHYLLQLLKQKSTRQKMAGRGANIQNLNQRILSELQIVLPPIEQQQEFISFVKQSDKSKFELKDTIENVNAMRIRIVEDNFYEVGKE